MRLVHEALAPAALEASLLAAADLEREREAIEGHWRQRIERAGYEAERMRRQFNAVEPENRLVARTLERQWEQALAEQARLEAEHERVRRNQPCGVEPWRRSPPVRELATRSAGHLVRRDSGGAPNDLFACCWNGSWSKSSMAASKCASPVTGTAAARTSHQLIRPVARLGSAQYLRLPWWHVWLNSIVPGRATLLLLKRSILRVGDRPSVVTRSMDRWCIISCSKAGIATPRYRRRSPEHRSRSRRVDDRRTGPTYSDARSRPCTPGSSRGAYAAAQIASRWPPVYTGACR